MDAVPVDGLSIILHCGQYCRSLLRMGTRAATTLLIVVGHQHLDADGEPPANRGQRAGHRLALPTVTPRPPRGAIGNPVCPPPAPLTAPRWTSR